MEKYGYKRFLLIYDFSIFKKTLYNKKLTYLTRLDLKAFGALKLRNIKGKASKFSYNRLFSYYRLIPIYFIRLREFLIDYKLEARIKIKGLVVR